MLEMERLEAELVRERRPPPTWEELDITIIPMNLGQIAKWLIKSNYVKIAQASNSLFNFANNGKKPHHIASHSKCS